MELILISTLIGAAEPPRKPTMQRNRGRAVARIVRPARASALAWKRGSKGAQATKRLIVDRSGVKRPYRLLEYE